MVLAIDHHRSQMTDVCRSAPRLDAAAPLDRAVRTLLERAFSVDLSGVRVHAGPRTDDMLGRHQLIAAAAGHRVLLGSTVAAEQGSDRWLGVVAHEVAHTIQQARDVSWSSDVSEWEACAAADAVLAGRSFDFRSERAPHAGQGARVLAGYNSWEHKLLGDVGASDLSLIMQRGAGWQLVAKRVIDVLTLFKDGSTSVTPAAIHAIDPALQLVTLGGAGVATYGELTAIPDFVANIGGFSTVPAPILFTFLQTIRQETYLQLATMVFGSKPGVQYVGAPPTGQNWILPDELTEVDWIDAATKALGTDHYTGLLARNACHFAPFAWYRWRAAHLQARDLAKQSFDATAPSDKATLANQAMIAQGFADHFLQDCFAPGHLTNKTMVMQQFVSWAATSLVIPILNWEAVSEVTLAHQPALQGTPLYQVATYTGPSPDPQSAQEAATLTERMTLSGVQGYGHVSQPQAYQQYLAFLQSPTVQLSSKLVHDYYNALGVTVKSDDDADEFTTFGDGDLLKTDNAAGLARASRAVAASQGAITGILRTGVSAQSAAQILAMLPMHVKNLAGVFQSVGDWQEDVWNQTPTIFYGDGAPNRFVNYLKYTGAAAYQQTMGLVSLDQLGTTMAEVWTKELPHGGLPAILWEGEQLFVAFPGGYIYELDPRNNVEIQSFTEPGDQPANTMRLATDGTHLFVLNHAGLGAYDRTKLDPSLWGVRGLGGSFSAAGVTMVYAADKNVIYTGSDDGYVWELDAAPNSAHRFLQSQYFWGYGKVPARLAVTADFLVVGLDKQFVGLARTNLGIGVWRTPAYDSTSPVANVLTIASLVYGACGSTIVVIDPTKGVTPPINVVTDTLTGEVRQATNGTYLFRGSNGVVTAHGLFELTTGAKTPFKWIKTLLENTPAPPATPWITNLLVHGERLFVSVSNTVFMLDPYSGSILQRYSITSATSPGGEVAMACDGVTLFCAIGNETDGFVVALEIRS
jgi:uncharacterized protein DUF4157